MAAPRTTSTLFTAAGLLFALFSMVKSDEFCDLEIENTLKALLTPQENPSIQLQALRREILRKLQQSSVDVDDDDQERDFKRSFSSLAKWNNLPGKRNLEALARAGYIRTQDSQEEEEDVDSLKRSIAALAKNGQLPTTVADDAEKRGIESLAKSGDLRHHHHRETRELLDDLYGGGKRNVGALARSFGLPAKRFLASLARSGGSALSAATGKRGVAEVARDSTSRMGGKRNVAALLRQDSYMNSNYETRTEQPQQAADKRNIASIKAQYPAQYKREVRNKRQIDYFENEEYPAPVYQNQNYDYEDLMRILDGSYLNTEKRFLGSVAKSGWFRPSSSSVRQTLLEAPEKRHIGALARLGWLPTLRNVRRFNRSGRSTSDDSCREDPADGQAEDDAVAEDALPLDKGRRFLLQSPVDKVLLKQLFTHHHPRSHQFINSY